LILNPAIIALVASSLLTAGYALYASAIGMKVIRGWDLSSGSEHQLNLERKTYLISTVLAYLFGLGLFTLLLFIHTADHIHNFFVGAMCAAGSLNVNKFGYPVLIIKIANFILCGIWLILNYTDNKGIDYPLIKVKYKFLLLIAVLLVLEAYLLTEYFMALKANVITSCCGILFSQDASGIAGGIASLPAYATKVIFFLSLILTIRIGIQFYITGRPANIFSFCSIWLFFISLVSVISFISLYFYELPTHHCPFCLLQKEYNYIGYPLYLSLFAAGITGIGVGVLERVKGAVSLKKTIPAIQKRLCLFCLIGYAVFALIATYPMVFSNFRLEGY
jgi:hypothetical protein